MTCRMALALGLSPTEVGEMPARDFELLTRFYQQEPWGPWRDNMHAAIIAAEVRRPNLRKGATVKLDDFMLRSTLEDEAHRASKRRQGQRNLFELLKSVAKRRPSSG